MADALWTSTRIGPHCRAHGLHHAPHIGLDAGIALLAPSPDHLPQ